MARQNIKWGTIEAITVTDFHNMNETIIGEGRLYVLQQFDFFFDVVSSRNQGSDCLEGGLNRH